MIAEGKKFRGHWACLLRIVIGLALMSGTASGAPVGDRDVVKTVREIPGLVAFWTFQEDGGEARKAVGKHPFPLEEANGEVARVEGGVFGRYAAKLDYRQWFRLRRDDLGDLDISGKDAQLTMVAWIKRHKKPDGFCEAVAGVWDEERRKRQYALFVAMPVENADGKKEQVGGHISSIGGATKGHYASLSRANGATAVPHGEWVAIGFTYDGEMIRVFYNGELDSLDEVNPFWYPHGVFDGGKKGSDFTVGSVAREREPKGPGNFFVGVIGGLAVFDRALSEQEMVRLGELIDEKRSKESVGPND